MKLEEEHQLSMDYQLHGRSQRISAKRIQGRTLFATHYHQLIGLEGEASGLVNVHVQVAESDGELKFYTPLQTVLVMIPMVFKSQR